MVQILRYFFPNELVSNIDHTCPLGGVSVLLRMNDGNRSCLVKALSGVPQYGEDFVWPYLQAVSAHWRNHRDQAGLTQPVRAVRRGLCVEVSVYPKIAPLLET